MNKIRALLLFNFAAYLSIFLSNRLPQLFESFKTIIQVSSTENAYFFTAVTSFVSIYLVLSLIYLFAYLKKEYQNKTTRRAAGLGAVAVMPLLLHLVLSITFGREFFSEGNPGSGLDLLMAFIIYPYVVAPLAIISTSLLVWGIAKDTNNSTVEQSRSRGITSMLLFIARAILHLSLIVSLLLLILTITIDHWDYMFFYVSIPVVAISLILWLLKKKYK